MGMAPDLTLTLTPRPTLPCPSLPSLFLIATADECGERFRTGAAPRSRHIGPGSGSAGCARALDGTTTSLEAARSGVVCGAWG